MVATCAFNLGALMFVQALQRRQELALRTALGAAGHRLLRLAVVEGAALGILGAVAGLTLAAGIVRAIVASAPILQVPRLSVVDLPTDIAWSIGAACVLGAGTVRDTTGAVVPRTNVTAIDTETATRTTVQSNYAGVYTFPRLRPGAYRVDFQRDGFRPLAHDGVQLLVATPTTLDVVLTVGDVTQEVSVVGASVPAINRLDATTGHTFTAAQIEALPFAARNPTNLLPLQPGVLFTGNSDPDQLLFGSAPRGLETQVTETER